MRKLFTLSMILVILMMLVACDSDAKQLTVNESTDTTQGEKSINEDKEQTEIYSNMVYTVGKDIEKGSYTIKCTKTNYMMEVVVFANKQAYEEFQKADKTTIGDYDEAIEAYAWTNFYIEENEELYLGLKKGNVILLNDGMCEFTRYDVKDSNKIYSGTYVVGEDINADKLNIECITEFLDITIFENEEAYITFRKTNRDTVGEEAEAINEHALSYKFLCKDDVTMIDFEEGMILLINDGCGEVSVDNGPTIN